jgi:radial spoke head protein 9
MPEMIKIREEDRLACTVHLIMQESAIFPRGYLFRNANGNIQVNPSYHGMNVADANEMKNFKLFRKPLKQHADDEIKPDNFDPLLDVFDTIEDVFPPRTFWFRTNSRGVVIVRSMLWMGMTFLMKINSPLHGFYYMGYGKKNFELPFMEIQHKM